MGCAVIINEQFLFNSQITSCGDKMDPDMLMTVTLNVRCYCEGCISLRLDREVWDKFTTRENSLLTLFFSHFVHLNYLDV